MLKELIKVFGYAFGIAMEFVVIITFLVAYFSPTNKVLVAINLFGEMHMELGLLSCI